MLYYQILHQRIAFQHHLKAAQNSGNYSNISWCLQFYDFRHKFLCLNLITAIEITAYGIM